MCFTKLGRRLRGVALRGGRQAGPRRHRDTGQWYRTHGNEHWQYDDDGLMSIQDVSANDVAIDEIERTLTG